jgi:hypothetical protein
MRILPKVYSNTYNPRRLRLNGVVTSVAVSIVVAPLEKPSLVDI